MTISYDRTLTWQDGKVSQAVVEWYNELKLTSFSGALLKECGQNRWNWVDVTVKLTSSRTMPQKNSDIQLINGHRTSRPLCDHEPYDYPAVTGPKGPIAIANGGGVHLPPSPFWYTVGRSTHTRPST